MIRLYGTPRSRALRVSWLLEELELPWEFHFVDMAKQQNRTPEFLALNPCGKIPVLEDDGLVLTESAAIMLYLAERYGEGRLLPKPGTAASGHHYQWLSFVITELEQPLWTMGKHRFALPEEQRVAAIQATAVWEFNKAAAIAEQWLPDSPFLLGDELTVADILLAHTLNWATIFEQQIPPKLAAYRDRLNLRPAMKKALDKASANLTD
ncbi:MAG: glutathione S-transferase family protein [Shewanella algae]|uniref:glutathione S-transferase family protein n=1 Tax=Shewanella algae TaxID=38313 RepID=UPI001AB01C59|nr:glutathione S-transferase family protein [Shewanella algae]EKT4487147.1 glutathione S-transferase family protein [Shewanella algae]MBO2549095.1 glutathione S-transferase family protein [Shewanella algae]